MARSMVYLLAMGIVASVAACASVRPGHDAAGRYETGTNAGGGE